MKPNFLSIYLLSSIYLSFYQSYLSDRLQRPDQLRHRLGLRRHRVVLQRREQPLLVRRRRVAERLLQRCHRRHLHWSNAVKSAALVAASSSI